MFPEVNFLATGGAEVQLSEAGKKVRVDFLYFVSGRRVISPTEGIQKENVGYGEWKAKSEFHRWWTNRDS